MNDNVIPRITTKPPIGCAMLMMDLFRHYLHQHRLPVTHQREAIAMALFESDQQLSVDDLADALRSRGEGLGKATIYRTLSLMVEAGLARELDFGEGFKRYEHQAGSTQHDHLVCSTCGRVVRFIRPEVDSLQTAIAAESGFKVQTRRFELYGECHECQAASGGAGDGHGATEGASAIAAGG